MSSLRSKESVLLRGFLDVVGLPAGLRALVLRVADLLLDDFRAVDVRVVRLREELVFFRAIVWGCWRLVVLRRKIAKKGDRNYSTNDLIGAGGDKGVGRYWGLR